MVDGVKIRKNKFSAEDVPYNSSNGTNANLESNPQENNYQNR